MFFQTSLIAMMASLLATSHSYVVTRDLPSGIYTGFIHANGTTTEPTLVSLLTIRSETIPSSLQARSLPDPKVGCKSYTMDKSSSGFGNAYNEFGSWCDSGNQIPGHWYTMIKSGNAVAYLCNYSEKVNTCTSNEWLQANQLIDANCGAPNAGWVEIDYWGKGYGRESIGVNICAAGYCTSC